MMNDCEKYPRFRWAVLLACGVAMLCTGMNTMSFAPLLGVIAGNLGVDLGTASLGLMGLGMLVMALSIGLAGFLIDRFGIFRVLVGAIGVQMLANAAFTLIGHSYETVLIIRLIESAALAPCFIVNGPVAAIWFPKNEIGIANGASVAMLQLGNMIGLAGAPLLVSMTGSWQSGIGSLSIVSLLSLLIAVVVANKSKYHQPPTLQPSRQDAEVAHKSFLKYPLFWVALIVNMLAMWCSQGFNDLMPAYLAVEPPVGAGFGPATAGQLMTIVSVSTMIFSLLGGFFIDKVFNGDNRKVILIGWVIGAISYPAIMISEVHNNVVILPVALVAAGVLGAFLGPALMGLGAKTFSPSAIGKVIGLWMFTGCFAGAGGVVGGSVALRSTGSYRLSMIIIVGLAIMGFIVSVFLKPGKSKTLCNYEAVKGQA
ncbi:MAG: transporter transrane protein [Firmicutes bacterium]|nr:transporter transrane protein [Bacillota bacterium]